MRMTAYVAAAARSEIRRFMIVGGASTALYVALTLVFERADVAFAPASAISYFAAGVFSFLGHRAFTFASNGFWMSEAARFAALNLAGLLAASTAPFILANRFGMAPPHAILVICVAAPAINYLAMRSLVFCRARRRTFSAP